MTDEGVTCVHLTRIRPGRLDEVRRRLMSYEGDQTRSRRQRIRRIAFFATTERADAFGPLVVAVIEADDGAAVERFLDENEEANLELIAQLYETHGHEGAGTERPSPTWSLSADAGSRSETAVLQPLLPVTTQT